MDTTHTLLAERENPEQWEREYRENPEGFTEALQEIEKTHGSLVLVRAWKARLMEVVVSKFPRSFWYAAAATMVAYVVAEYFDTSIAGKFGFPLMMWIVPFLLHYVWLHRKQIAHAPYVAGGVVLVGALMYGAPHFMAESDTFQVMGRLTTFQFFLGLSVLVSFFGYVGKRHIDTYIDTVTRLCSWALLTAALYIATVILMFSFISAGFSFSQFDRLGMYVLALVNGLVPFVAYYILDRSQNWLKPAKLSAKLFVLPLAIVALGLFFRVVYMLLSGSLGFVFTHSFFGVSVALLAFLFVASLIMKHTKNIFHFARFESLFFGLVSGVSAVMVISAVVLYFQGGSAFWTDPYMGKTTTDVTHQWHWWGIVGYSVIMSVHAGWLSYAAVQRQLGAVSSRNLPLYLFLGYPVVSIGAIVALLFLA